MGIIRHPLPVKLFFGMLSPDPKLFDTCIDLLGDQYGPFDYTSAVWAWDKTDYYQKEMGTGILRKFIFCERLIDPALLPSIKRFTNELERTPLERPIYRRNAERIVIAVRSTIGIVS